MLSGFFPFLDDDSKLVAEPELISLNISPEAKDFLSELLHKDKFERLGSKQNVKKVKEHPFFNNINWHQIEKGVLKPPYRPEVVISVSKEIAYFLFYLKINQYKGFTIRYTKFLFKSIDS